MIKIGIDPSLTNTAICLISDDITEETIECFQEDEEWKFKQISNNVFTLTQTFKINSNTREEGRGLHNAASSIAQLFSDLQDSEYKIQIGIEEPMGGNMGKGALSHRLYGAIISTLAAYDFEYEVFKPSQIKKHLTGKGNAKKEIMIKEAYKKYGVEFNTNDEVDAFAIAMMVGL